MNPNEGVLSGTCGGFYNGFQKMQPVQPLGPSGSGVQPSSYPYGTTPVKYFPSGSSSVGRSAWDGWRYGAGYIGPNDGKVYGEPDYKYNRNNYCGPCGCGPEGYMGDANGKNPNIRYVQLDYKNLLGAGFAQQGVGQSATSQVVFGQGGPPPPTQTSCGRQHCTHCSGVFKKTEQPVKFQVCLGDPETTPPCPQQSVNVYVPNQMIPNCGPGGDQNPQQMFEVSIPGQTDRISQLKAGNAPEPSNESGKKKTLKDPCGSCKACKNMQKPNKCSGKNSSSSSGPEGQSCVVRSPLTKSEAQPCEDTVKPRNCHFNGQRYTTEPILTNVKKPSRPTCLRKANKK